MLELLRDTRSICAACKYVTDGIGLSVIDEWDKAIGWWRVLSTWSSEVKLSYVEASDLGDYEKNRCNLK